jgi:hypothetical protein
MIVNSKGRECKLNCPAKLDRDCPGWYPCEGNVVKIEVVHEGLVRDIYVPRQEADHA